MKHIFFIILFAINLINISKCNGQNPGGVDKILFWFKTTTPKQNQYSWIDNSNSRYTLENFKSEKKLNINFHEALFFSGNKDKPSPTLNLHNVELDQATIIANIYPEYLDGQKMPTSKVFYDLSYNGRKKYSFNFNEIKPYVSSLPLLSLGEKFQLASFSEVISSMVPLEYPLAGLPNNLNPVLGKDKEISINFNFKGYIPEFIIYKRGLSKGDLQKIRSYLSIKYGQTLDAFYNSKGEIIWDKTREKNKDYHNRVCAIGKDLFGAIKQPVSNTTYEEFYNANHSYFYDSNNINNRSLTIGFLDTTLNKLVDKQFLFWGDNNKSVKKFTQIDNLNFPGLEVVDRGWLMQNDRNIDLPTNLFIGGVLLQELSSKVDQCYVLVNLDKSLESDDIYPLTNNLLSNHRWNSGYSNYTFGRVEKLRFRVKVASKNLKEDRKDCDKINDLKGSFNFSNIEKEGKYYYYREESVIGNCINRIVYTYENNNLSFYMDGGIKMDEGIESFECVILNESGIEVFRKKLKKSSGSAYSLPVDLMQGKYNLLVKDKSRQTIQMPLEIK